MKREWAKVDEEGSLIARGGYQREGGDSPSLPGVLRPVGNGDDEKGLDGCAPNFI